jgi:hypothetical protein
VEREFLDQSLPKNMDWIHVGQERAQLQALANTVLKLLVP